MLRRLLMRRWLSYALAAATAILLVAASFVVLFGHGHGAPAPEHHASASTRSTTTPTEQAPPPRPSLPPIRRAIVEHGSLVVDGSPLFPIFSWGECTDGFQTSLPVGVNLYAGNRCGGIQAQLDVLAGRALSAAVAGEEDVPASPDVIGVFYPDEADARGITQATLPDVAPGSGVRFLTLSNHFYSGAAPLTYGRGMYPGLVAKADMVGFDLYPLQSWCRPERLVDVYLAQRELVRLARARPTYQWIEAAGMDLCPHGRTLVTPDTVRAESWLAVAGGARGLGYFPPAAWTGDVGRAISEVTETIRVLGPALLGPDVQVSVEPADGLVKAGARSRDGGLTIVVANAAYAPRRATVTVPGLADRTLTEVRSQRTIAPRGDSFSISLPGLGTGVYVAGGRLSG
jgi:hypothetical protein